jgi:glycerate dehydrogenase
MNIVILDYATFNNGDITALEDMAQSLICYDSTQPHHVIERCKKADIAITNKVVFNRDLLEQLSNLKLICIAATGTNNVDLIAAKEFDIAVTNVVGYSTYSVVQHTFSLIFNLLGNTHRYLDDCRNHAWQASEHFCLLTYSIEEVFDKTIAIIGYGELGQAVERAAIAFGLKVIIAERKGHTPRAGRVSFEQALSQADIISLHCPLTDETCNMISECELSLMKPSSLIINTARGGIVDESALVKALINNQIAGAAFDVLTVEPAESTNPLMQYTGNNLLITPHIAWASKQSIVRLIDEIALNIRAFQTGNKRNRV